MKIVTEVSEHIVCAHSDYAELRSFRVYEKKFVH